MFIYIYIYIYIIWSVLALFLKPSFVHEMDFASERLDNTVQKAGFQLAPTRFWHYRYSAGVRLGQGDFLVLADRPEPYYGPPGAGQDDSDGGRRLQPFLGVSVLRLRILGASSRCPASHAALKPQLYPQLLMQQ